MSDIIKCARCEQVINSTDESYTTHNGDYICSDCYGDSYFTCYDCGEVHEVDNATYIRDIGDYVCRYCLDDYSSCEMCGEYMHSDYVHYRGDYALCESCSEVYYICDGCGELVHEEDICSDDDSEEYLCSSCYRHGLSSYHSNEGYNEDKSESYRYRYGVELEKEDSYIRECVVDDKEYYTSRDWRIEKDCSLDRLTGFEAITPILPLRIRDIKAYYRDEKIRKIVGANYSDSCGGHMTISDIKRTPDQIIDDIGGYLPILYAIMPNRLNNHYCPIHNKETYKTAHERCAIHKRGAWKGDGLEFRLFDSPSNVQDLEARLRILLFMLQHKADTFERALQYLSENEKLRNAVKTILDIKDIDYTEFYTNIVKFTSRYEGVSVHNIINKISKLRKGDN